MEYVDATKLKPKQAKQLVMDLQKRIYSLENCLDDLSRSVEIAQYSKQYHVTETFVRDAEHLLKDRLVFPEIEQADMKYTIIEGELSQDTIEEIQKKHAKV